jgi:hypothetical protein
MQVHELLEDLKIEKQKASFWKKWWVQRIIALIERILEKKATEFLNKK